MTMGKRSAARERHPAALDGESGTGRVRAARGRVGTRGRQGTIDRSFFSWEKNTTSALDGLLWPVWFRGVVQTRVL
jgi:hypothetical protein